MICAVFLTCHKKYQSMKRQIGKQIQAHTQEIKTNKIAQRFKIIVNPDI
jgi:hypothetical protein